MFVDKVSGDLYKEVIKLQPKHITVIGDQIIDIEHHGKFTRIAQEETCPVFVRHRNTTQFGGAWNVVKVLQQFGCKTDLINNDYSSYKHRYFVNGNLVFRDDEDTVVSKTTPLNIPENTDYILVSDYGKGTVNEITMYELNESEKRYSIDPGRREFWGDIFYRAEFVKCNHTEIKDDTYPIIKTQDRFGVYFNDKNYPTIPVENKSTIGAGDAFFAMLGICRANNLNMPHTLELCNIAAWLFINKISVNKPNILKQILPKVVDVSCIKQTYDKVTFTNGCFDVLHSGHLNLLRYCRSLGNPVIVAINDDESVKRLKGKHRPRNFLTHRLAMLREIPYIDHIIILSDDSPHKLMDILRPDIYVKGSDWKIDDLIGKEFCNEILLCEHNGISTTEILND